MRWQTSRPVVERIRGRRGVLLRQRFRARQPLCVACQLKGIVRLAEHIDHIVPLAKGGSNEPTNLQPLCVPCHVTKTAKDEGRKPRHQVLDASGWPIDD